LRISQEHVQFIKPFKPAATLGRNIT